MRNAQPRILCHEASCNHNAWTSMRWACASVGATGGAPPESEADFGLTGRTGETNRRHLAGARAKLALVLVAVHPSIGGFEQGLERLPVLAAHRDADADAQRDGGAVRG